MQTLKSKHAFDNFIENRLSTYGAMAVAIMASAAVNPARAAVIVWDPSDLVTGTNGNIYFNLTTGAANNATSAGMDFRLGHSVTNSSSSGFSYTTFRARATGLSPNAGVLSNGGFGARLTTSQSVGANGSFGSSLLLGSRQVSSSTFTIATNGPFGNGGRGFIGLRFEIASVAHYGWADITVDPNNMEITLHRFAYNDVAGQDIHATDANVPEPSSALLLAIGAAGLAAYRRKKKAA